jgi:dynein heavy chain
VEANKVKAIVMVEEAAANEKAQASTIINADTEAELALVMPILESALKVMILLFL